jgi:hypothetical protein
MISGCRRQSASIFTDRRRRGSLANLDKRRTLIPPARPREGDQGVAELL